MSLTDILAQAGGLQSLARDLGVSEDQEAAGAEALLPAILGGLKKQAQAQPSGLEGLGGLLGSLGGMFGAGAGAGAASAGGVLGSLTAMLDVNGDGNALDDILRAVGKASG